MSSFWENMAMLGQVANIYFALCLVSIWTHMLLVFIWNALITIKNNINE